jgi:CRP/FNR family cyclic AMP-dependent transcriptional regulator
MTAPPAVPDDQLRHSDPVLGREKGHEVPLDLHRIGLLGPLESLGQPQDMGIDGDAGHSEGLAEDHVGGLAADTGQAHEVVEVLGYLPAEAVAQHLTDAKQRGGLVPEEAGRGDDALKVGTVSGSQSGRGWVGGKELRGDPVDPLIGALSAQNSGHQQLKGGGEVQLAADVGVLLGQTREDGSGPFPESRVIAHPLRIGAATPRRFTPNSFIRHNAAVDDVLMQAPLFTALDPEGAAALRASLVERAVSKGDVVFVEGEPGDRMYVILEGKVKLGQTSGDGRESLLAILGPGEMFGELSLFDPGQRTSTATALTDAVVLALSHEQLKPWLAGRPEVATSLLQALARRLRRTNEAMADLVFSDVPGRVAKALMDLGEKFGEITPEGLMVTHDMTQEELAQLVGASRETVNKALADFAQRGWIRLESRQVMILDVERLGRRAR